MLNEPDLDGDQDIVADNIRVVQAIYFASQLEDMRMFQVVERLVQLFQQGQLPLGRGQGRRLVRSFVTADARPSLRDRRVLYVRALGVPGGEGDGPQPNREFQLLWLRFIASVAMYQRQQGATAPQGSSGLAHARVRRSARALAANASAHGAGLRRATRRLAVEVNRMRELLEAHDIRQAYGARDMWQVIDQVASIELGGSVNVARHRTRAVAASTVLQWLADHADALSRPAASSGDALAIDPTLINAVDQWLASTADGVDATLTPSRGLVAVADELLRVLGLQGAAARAPRSDLRVGQQLNEPRALFCGAAGSGKSLGAHALAATLGRDLLRVDLGEVVGKYIGETEKNLDAVLQQAERAGAILLLDEADALFGGRSEVADAHDRYANLEIGHLLQRLEAFSGLVVIASNTTPAGAEPEGLAGLSHVVRFPCEPKP